MSKFNWQAIKTYFITHEDASYKDLSDKYHVSTTAIKHYQKRHHENWHELREKTIQNVSQKLPEKLGEKMTEINASHIKIGKLLQQQGLLAIARSEVKITSSCVCQVIGLVH
jgi:hypothetical protein